MSETKYETIGTCDDCGATGRNIRSQYACITYCCEKLVCIDKCSPICKTCNKINNITINHVVDGCERCTEKRCVTAHDYEYICKSCKSMNFVPILWEGLSFISHELHYTHSK